MKKRRGVGGGMVDNELMEIEELSGVAVDSMLCSQYELAK